MSTITLDTRDRVLAGIALTGFAYFLFTVHDAVVKLLVATIPVWQVLFFRSLTILTGCLVFGGGAAYRRAWHLPLFPPLFLRSFLILPALLLYFKAPRLLHLPPLTP